MVAGGPSGATRRGSAARAEPAKLGEAASRCRGLRRDGGGIPDLPQAGARQGDEAAVEGRRGGGDGDRE